MTCWRATASNARPSPGPAPFEFESASGVYTELQCGSYIFMDADYGRNLDRDGAPTKAFEPSLFVWATVMSRPTEDRALPAWRGGSCVITYLVGLSDRDPAHLPRI